MVRKALTGLILIGVLAVMTVDMTVPFSTSAAAPPPTCAPGSNPCGFTPLPEPRLAKLDQAALAKIDLKTYPAVPAIPDQIAAIYQEGVRRGNNPRIFSKVGDIELPLRGMDTVCPAIYPGTRSVE